MPFVENAIKHSAVAEGPSFVNLWVTEEDRQLICRVENSKSVRLSTASPGGISLKNTQRRL